MARLTFTNRNDYLWRAYNFDDFSITALSANRIRLDYDEGLAGRPFEEARAPARIIVNIADGALREITTGPDRGDDVFSSGTIRNIRFLDEDGRGLITMTDIDMSARLFQLFHEREPWRLYDNLVAGDSIFIDNRSTENGSDIDTGAGDDVVRARPGAGTFIKDNGGADRYLGHADSYDTVTYDNWFFSSTPITNGIFANLARNFIDGPDGNRDVARSIDEVRGTHLDDRFLGSGERDHFAGLAGEDTFNGRGGRDQVRYDRDENFGGMEGITANLRKGFVIDGFGDRDTLVMRNRQSTVEEVRGTDFEDVFIDDRGDNFFEGRDGDDRFLLSRGNDYVIGGEGADLFVFRGRNFDGNGIGDFDRSEGDKMRVQAADSFADLTLTERGDGTLVELNGTSSSFLIENAFGIQESDFLF
jgi:Ca2+-binding RTX toxin-like protein